MDASSRCTQAGRRVSKHGVRRRVLDEGAWGLWHLGAWFGLKVLDLVQSVQEWRWPPSLD